MRSKILAVVLSTSLLLAHIPVTGRQIKERKLTPPATEYLEDSNCECTLVFYDQHNPNEELGRVYKCSDGSILLIYYTEEGLQKIKDEIDRTLGY
jgi:hypothetical protein